MGALLTGVTRALARRGWESNPRMEVFCNLCLPALHRRTNCVENLKARSTWGGGAADQWSCPRLRKWMSVQHQGAGTDHSSASRQGSARVSWISGTHGLKGR